MDQLEGGDISIEHFLQDQRDFYNSNGCLQRQFQDSTVLLTGATGALGTLRQFQDSTVLLTGAAGALGTLVLEKLLRCTKVTASSASSRTARCCSLELQEHGAAHWSCRSSRNSCTRETTQRQFQDSTVLLTGATGALGTLLLEKLLSYRSSRNSFTRETTQVISQWLYRCTKVTASSASSRTARCCSLELQALGTLVETTQDSTVLLTGAAGALGTLVLEKLLR
ncbi:hypothetical protein J6590_056115 [Homalodisca vitripennis]|nr:hypothetical protein J6590_056115 [Homalodisca vitripennis]